MNVENTATRLQKLMKSKGLKQVDLLQLLKPYCEKYNIKMNKSDISQYLSNKVKPSQEKLVILGMALEVSEAWLMGLDVQMEEPNQVGHHKLTNNEITLLNNYNELNDFGKKEALKRVSELTEINIYREQYVAEGRGTYEIETIAAHNDNLTAEEIKDMDSKIEEFEKR